MTGTVSVRLTGFVSSLMTVATRRAMSSESRAYVPRRALMYVPGCDERKMAKIPQIGADCICLDCEDGVAVNMKDAARKGIRELLDTQRVDFGVSECSVRVNSVDSGLCKDDVLEVLGGANMPSAIHLPKVAGREELAFLATCIREAVNKPLDRKLGLIMFIESARSLLDIDSICKAAWEISEAGADFIPEALVFGSDDFAADIGATRTKENTELLLARQQVVVAAKAHRLQAIDAVYIDYKDREGLQRQAEEGARWGFTGKQVLGRRVTEPTSLIILLSGDPPGSGECGSGSVQPESVAGRVGHCSVGGARQAPGGRQGRVQLQGRHD